MKILIILLVLFIIIGLDMRLKIQRYTINGNVDFKIIHITDLHGCYYGKDMSSLVNIIDDENPDIVVYSGDIFDDKHPYKNSIILIEKISKYPSYYVNGNHEHWSCDMKNIEKILNDNGVKILNDETTRYGDTDIYISGIEDPASDSNLHEQLESLELKGDGYNILLAHRPENVEEYIKYDFDLIFTGHAHGGQWRLPYILNGLFAPNQGLFPKYAGGLYGFGKTNFIVSRGLARESTIVPRFYNRPELVVVEIKKEI